MKDSNQMTSSLLGDHAIECGNIKITDEMLEACGEVLYEMLSDNPEVGQHVSNTYGEILAEVVLKRALEFARDKNGQGSH